MSASSLMIKICFEAVADMPNEKYSTGISHNYKTKKVGSYTSCSPQEHTNITLSKDLLTIDTQITVGVEESGVHSGAVRRIFSYER